jgi:hypothetical protein
MKLPLLDFDDVFLGDLQKCRAKENIGSIEVRMKTNTEVSDIYLAL